MKKMGLSLMALVLALVVSTSTFSSALAESAPGSPLSGLTIEAPGIWDIGEAVTIKVTMDSQPVAEASIYAFRPEKGEMAPEMPGSSPGNRWTIEYSELLGTTNDSGELSYTFAQAGIYFLIASKDGYAPGFFRLVVKPSKSLEIEVAEEIKLGNAVEIKVIDATTDEPVAGASVYVLGRAKAERLARWLLGETFALVMPSAEGAEEYDWLIGTSDANGIVTHTFDRSGIYILIATQEGNAPGIARLIVRPEGALWIEAPRQADVGETIAIRVIDKDNGQVVSGATIYVLNKPLVEAEMGNLREKMGETIPEGVMGQVSSQQMLGWMGKSIAPDPHIVIPSELGEPVGTSNEKGEITYTFNEAQRYFLVAWKEGYAPGFHPIQVGVAAPIEVGTSSMAYFPGEIVTFWIENNTGEEITLPNSAPWQIIGADGAVVFSPLALQMIVPLAPGESREWTWDQTDSEGNQVAFGKYEVLITSSAGEYGAAFGIMPSLPVPLEPMPGQLKSVMMEKGPRGRIIFRTEVPAVTAERIYVDGSQLFIETPSGAKAIKMMPDDVLKAKMRAQKVHQLELKMWNNKPVYEVEGVARARLFGIIPINIKIKTLVDADSGEVVKEGKPWWAVLAKMPGKGEVSYEQA